MITVDNISTIYEQVRLTLFSNNQYGHFLTVFVNIIPSVGVYVTNFTTTQMPSLNVGASQSSIKHV